MTTNVTLEQDTKNGNKRQNTGIWSHAMHGFSFSSSSDRLTEEQENEIAENIYDWWISGKSYKEWYADRISRRRINIKILTMNENIDLTKILKDCPEGFKLYSPMYGEVEFKEMCVSSRYAIKISCGHSLVSFTKKGLYYDSAGAECLLFPSQEQRDWSKFKAPWHKNDKFDPETLVPFDKVLVRDTHSKPWRCSIFSHIENERHLFPYATSGGNYSFCIPFNDDTKHLVGTTEEAPEYYRYLED